MTITDLKLCAIALALATPMLAAGPSAAPVPQAPADRRALFDAGVPFADFLAAARSRRDTWTGNYEGATVPAALGARIAALAGRWRLLAVAEDWCGDSANTVPYVARLVEGRDNVELRVINSTRGRPIIDAHPTPDGRAATPTIVVLDEEFREAGCLIEQPAPLAAWSARMRPVLSRDELHERQRAFYTWDRGEATMTEIVEMLEGAAAGTPRCGGH